MANFYAQYPASSGGSSANASVGINGVTAPTSSTEVGGINPTGNLQPLQTDASGNLLVSLAAEPVNPFSVNLSAVGGAAISEGQKLMAASLPVVIASDQSTLPISAAALPLPSGASTSALQTSGNAQLVTIASNQTNGTQVTSVNSSALPTGASTAANQTNASQKTQVVDGTGNVITSTNDGGGKQGLDVNIAGAATLAVSSSSFGGFLATVIGNTSAGSGGSTGLITVQGNASGTPIPVSGTVTAANASVGTVGSAAPTSATEVGGSDGTNLRALSVSTTGVLNVADGSLDLYTTGAGPATAVINTNLLLAVTGTTSFDMQGYRSISFQVETGASTTAVAVNFEGSDDNVNFISIGMYDKTTPTAAPVTTFTTAASTHRFFEGPVQLRYFRVRLVAAITAGTVQAFSIARKTEYVPTQMSLAAGTQIIGALSANQSTNVAQINGVAPLMGNGVTGTGSLRVTLASDTSSNTNPLLVSTSGRSLANAPTVTTYATPVTSAAYVTIIASTTSATNLVEIFDSSGVAIFLAVGAAASEVNQFVIYPGGNGQVPLKIPAGSRISYKAVSTSATGASAFNVLNLYT